jgi:hypothetical protein
MTSHWKLDLLNLSIQNSRYKIILKKDLISFTIYHFIYRGSTNMRPMPLERYHDKLPIEIWITQFAHTENILWILPDHRSNQILSRFLEKNRSGPDLTEPGRQATGRPRSDAARQERPIRTAGRRARPVSGTGGQSGTRRQAPFDQVKIDGLGLLFLR